jgi:hypothetical protein
LELNVLDDPTRFAIDAVSCSLLQKTFCHREVGFSAMKAKAFFISWPLFACLVLFTPGAFCAEVYEEARYSLQFRSVSISEALKQIAQTTGIKIATPMHLGNQVITRSYENQTIEGILKDMFRDMNFALVWSYGEKGIDSVKIVAFDRGSDAGGRYAPKAAGSTIRDYRAGGYPAQRRTRPERALSPPIGPTVDTEPEASEPEVSAEREEEEGDQEEAGSEEEKKESMSSSEDSDEQAPSGSD